MPIIDSRWLPIPLWVGTLTLWCSWAASASADQAAYLSRAQAIAAGNQIQLDQEVRLYCQPCGDTWVESLRIAQIEVSHTGYQDYFELKLNDHAIDLAYTYIRHGDHWHNLAMLLDLEVVEVPQLLPEDLEVLPQALDSDPDAEMRH